MEKNAKAQSHDVIRDQRLRQKKKKRFQLSTRRRFMLVVWGLLVHIQIMGLVRHIRLVIAAVSFVAGIIVRAMTPGHCCASFVVQNTEVYDGLDSLPKSLSNAFHRTREAEGPMTVARFRSRRKRRDYYTALMCQLLGMNCATPTDFTFSFTGFAARGGDTDNHSDGWGLAFYEGRGIRAFHDSLPAAQSPVAALMKSYPCKTLNMLSHIRFATEGKVSLENVHPFQREMWGIQWVFAHNGDVPKFSRNREHPWLGSKHGEKTYHPVGDTDSEAIFCALLNALRSKFDTLPTLPVLYEEIKGLVDRIVPSGGGGGQDDDDDGTILNFLLTCGQHVQFAYSWPGSRPGSDVWNGLYYTIREPPFKMTRLKDCDVCVDFAEVTTEHDRVAVIATAPLTDDEVWVEVKRGELILFDEGLPHVAEDDLFRVEMLGHGLSSNALPKLALDQRHLVLQYGQDI